MGVRSAGHCGTGEPYGAFDPAPPHALVAGETFADIPRQGRVQRLEISTCRSETAAGVTPGTRDA